MDFELHSGAILRTRTFNVMIAPRSLFIKALNDHLNLQRFQVLYICGNYSSILSGLSRKIRDMAVRRAFTVFQLMTILEESRHTILLIEHDPIIYEDAAEMVGYVSKALRDAARESTVLLYAPRNDPFLEELANMADRAFYFNDGPRDAAKLTVKASPKMDKSQTTLEVF